MGVLDDIQAVADEVDAKGDAILAKLDEALAREAVDPEKAARILATLRGEVEQFDAKLTPPAPAPEPAPAG